MSIVTMDMSSYEVSHSDGDESVQSNWTPALALQEQNELADAMPQDMVTMNTDVFIKRMYNIEVNAKAFLKNMYVCQ